MSFAQSNEPLPLITNNMAAPVTRCTRDLRHVWANRGYAAGLVTARGDCRPILVMAPSARAKLSSPNCVNGADLLDVITDNMRQYAGSEKPCH